MKMQHLYCTLHRTGFRSREKSFGQKMRPTSVAIYHHAWEKKKLEGQHIYIPTCLGIPALITGMPTTRQQFINIQVGYRHEEKHSPPRSPLSLLSPSFPPPPPLPPLWHAHVSMSNPLLFWRFLHNCKRSVGSAEERKAVSN